MMENIKATVHVYDYDKPKIRKEKNKRKSFFQTLLEIIVAVVVIGAIVYIVIQYSNKEKLTEIDKKISTSIELMQEIVKSDTFTDEYLLVIFPDTEGIVSIDGYIKNSVGAVYNEFQDGYIIMYKNGNYEYELQDDKYCSYKKLGKDKYTVSIFKKCTNTKVQYLKK